ncbi:tetratricopeptide repeat protein [Pelagicoccus sp. SDUM812003]|uniref:tetratricopeptide repeat protein n=1 Tax=Pelagicoccus sp. SDUM812003 TaxID=3041267 RepID=UPI00280D82BD|nr:tetratricopeptide repeat protein [Pelagicoccus sp. SDUM812003]MDQ8203463.1 tetratricopeptide repeat protein [Pelagicoccus sp. SDUM812003]
MSQPIKAFITLLLCLAATTTIVSKDWGRPDLEGDEFEKRFTASYGVLSEKEPPIDELEVQILEKLAPMMRVNREYAQTLLESMTVGDAPRSATFNYLLGNVYFENDEYFLAEEQYKTAIEKFPDFQRAWTNLGVLKLRSDDTRNALVSFLKAVELGDTKPSTFGMLGYCHFRQGNFISAEVAYDRAMLSEPNNLDWLEGKAQVYLEADRFAEAIHTQDELIARRPNDTDYWLAQANAYLAIENLRQAARNLEIVRSIGKANFQSLYQLGNLYSNLGLFGPASDAYLDAAPLAESSDISFLIAATNVLIRNEQIELAKDLFSKIEITSYPTDSDTRFSYYSIAAEIAYHEGDLYASIERLEEATQFDPTNGKALVKLARRYIEADKRDKAYLLLDRAERDPEAEYPAVLTRAKLLIEEKRFSESQPYVARALKLQSSDSIQVLYQQVEDAVRNRD